MTDSPVSDYSFCEKSTLLIYLSIHSLNKYYLSSYRSEMFLSDENITVNKIDKILAVPFIF